MGLWQQWREDWRAAGGNWSRPGLHAVLVYRLGHWAAGRGRISRALLMLLYRPMYWFVRNVYGIELYYPTQIGRRFVIGHQSGIVIHPQAVIGDDCVIRQNVTIGSVSNDQIDRAPKLGNRVQVGAGAVIVGGVTIGDDARIGPNAVIMTNVPAGAMAVAPPARIVQMNKPAAPASAEPAGV